MVESNGLLNRRTGHTVPRVRIPLSPPLCKHLINKALNWLRVTSERIMVHKVVRSSLRSSVVRLGFFIWIITHGCRNQGGGGYSRGSLCNLYSSTALEKIVALAGLLHVWFYYENKHLYHLKYSNCQRWGPHRPGLFAI